MGSERLKRSESICRSARLGADSAENLKLLSGHVAVTLGEGKEENPSPFAPRNEQCHLNLERETETCHSPVVYFRIFSLVLTGSVRPFFQASGLSRRIELPV